MKNEILWLLDNEENHVAFERLCTSLMYRWGFRRIEPIGRNRDRGRDAEATVFLGEGKGSERIFFQFTLEDRWEPKLQRELKKVKRNNHSINRYVFVTRKDVTGEKRDALTIEIKDTYGWTFQIFGREFLRHSLEEAYPGLAERYLGATPLASGKQFDPLQVLPPIDYADQPIWNLVNEGQHEKAIIRLRQIIETPETSELPHHAAWSAMAWSYYKKGAYKEGLRCVEDSIRLKPSAHNKSIKGCLLCEYGLETASRALLVEARSIFESLLPGATDYHVFYDLGNVLTGLDDHIGARDAFREALAFNDKVAEIWKNLGSCYFKLKEHEEELKCYEQALQLNPSLPQALVSKANTLILLFQDYTSALSLFDKAFDVAPNFAFEWPHVYWWKAFCLFKLERLEEALQIIQVGLIENPAYTKLFDLQASVLRRLWRQDRQHLGKATLFFKRRLEINPGEYRTFVELAELAIAQNDERSACGYLAAALSEIIPEFSFVAEDIETYLPFADIMSLFQKVDSYLEYRQVKPLRHFAEFYPEGKEKCGYRHLWLTLGMSFTKLQQSSQSLANPSIDQLIVFLKEARSSTKNAVAQASRITAEEYEGASKEDKIDILTTLLYVLSQTIFFEAIWVSGYLLGTKSVDKNQVESATELFTRGNNLNPWRTEVTEAVMSSVNAVWKLFPDSQEPRVKTRGM